MLWPIVIFAVVIGAVLVMAIFVHAPDDSDSFDDESDDALESAALDLSRIDQGDVLVGYSPEQAAKARERTAAYRREAEAIADRRWRKAHLEWVAYSERCIDEAEDTWREKRAEKAARTRDPLRKGNHL